MNNFDGGAVQRSHDIVLFVRLGADVVLSDRQPAIDIHRQLALRRGKQDAERYGRPIHVFMHAMHIARWLQVVPTSLEANPLAHQPYSLLGFWMCVVQMHDGGIFVRAALRYSHESARAQLVQFLKIKFNMLPAMLLCEYLYPRPV